MATIIDTLLVELGIDPSKMSKGQKDASNSLRKFEDESNKTSKNVEAHGEKMAQAIYKVRNQVLSLLTAFTAGTGLKQFFQQMTTGDAAAGRMAKNIGISVEQMTAWQGVAERAGGSAEGIANTMAGLSQQFQQLALTGQSAVIPYFRAVGVQIVDAHGKMRPMNDLLLDLSDKFSQMDSARAQAIGRGMGIDEGTINVLMQGRTAVTDLLREQERLGHANREDAKAAQERLKVLTGLKQAFEDIGRKVLTDLTPAIIKLTNYLEKLADWFHKHPKEATVLIGGLTAAVVALSVAASVGAVAAFGSMAAAGVAAFASMVVAAAPLIATVAAIAAVGYGAYAGTRWLMDGGVKKIFNFVDGLAPDRGDRDSRKLPRGIRNNNPGNLNYVGQDGATKEEGPNGRFAVFKTMEEGIAALVDQLKRYGSRGIDSVREIISKYAPAFENNTKAYIDAIAKKLGVNPDAALNLQDNATLRALIEGITTIEVGKNKISAEQITRGLNFRSGNGNRVSQNSAHAETHIGSITIQTQATDANGIARGIGQATEKYFSTAAMADYGLA